MNIIPLNSFQKKAQNNNQVQKKEISIKISKHWWISNYSLKNNIKTDINYSINKKNSFLGNLESSHNKWNITRGDHRVSEPYVKDYAYYRELKNKILKYSIFPFIIFIIWIVSNISIILANVKF